MSDLDSRELEVSDDIEELFAALYAKGMTDGLPVIPPTEERVARMMRGIELAPEREIAVLPPRGGRATVEKIAINAVMAGCLPEYLPVLVAAVRAMAQPQFNLIGIQTTTNPVAPLALINGPIRGRIGVHCGAGALGPGWRANATIGRALRLILINIGGAMPGEIDKSILGMPGKYSLCLGELEESSPWEPFHVEQGHSAGTSTVTLLSVQGTQSCAASYLEPESILRMLSDTMATFGAN
ncbi:MAG TPA: UGSC family (seleno)protein, partial [Candidatus Didemnitutus sp.]